MIDFSKNGVVELREHILEVLKQIEIEYEVKILYACESGSRAWGFPSKDSDFDVRFIYVHKKDWYLSIDQLRDVLEVPKHDKISIPVDELLDVSGWELSKALKLLRKSNPALLEWLHSDIVYYQDLSTIDKLKEFATTIFAPVSSLYHYLNMATKNYQNFLQGDVVKIKKYFYVLRPVLAAKWIEKYNTIPPVEFRELLNDLLPSGELRDAINHLLEQKMAGEELDLEPRIEVINQFLNEVIDHLKEYAKGLNIDIPDPTERLNKFFRETLAEVWS